MSKENNYLPVQDRLATVYVDKIGHNLFVRKRVSVVLLYLPTFLAIYILLCLTYYNTEHDPRNEDPKSCRWVGGSCDWVDQ